MLSEAGIKFKIMELLYIKDNRKQIGNQWYRRGNTESLINDVRNRIYYYSTLLLIFELNSMGSDASAIFTKNLCKSMIHLRFLDCL
jgi:hypothetical protein